MTSRSTTTRFLWVALLIAAVGLGLAVVPPLVAAPDNAAIALRIADFLLAGQNTDGAIPDAPGANIANEDSNMEYALLGLAAAYRHSRDPRYLLGLERGIHWLAARQDMSATRWRGSWWYAYEATPPYRPVAISPGPDVADVRGVDATGALFVYLLYLHRQLSGRDVLARTYEANARAALDFLLTANRSPDGLFYNAWHKSAATGQWSLWKFRYAADQADVYLGMRAGWLLYGDDRYRRAANRLRAQTPTRFFLAAQQRFALGLYEDGSPEPSLGDFNGIFPQGYLPWVFGRHAHTLSAWQWLQGCVQPNGALVCYDGDPQFSLSVAVYALGAKGLGRPRPASSLQWLVGTPFDPSDGGVRDTADPASAKYSNVAGLTVMALLNVPPFP